MVGDINGVATDWSTWISGAFALGGALVGGGIVYLATLKGMRHEAELRRLERLRAVRGRMVEELTGPLSFAFKTDPIWTSSEALQVLENVVRLAYSATPEDLNLARQAQIQSAIFLDTASAVEQSGTLDRETGTIGYPPDGKELATSALDQLQRALTKLDLHLRDNLEE